MIQGRKLAEKFLGISEQRLFPRYALPGLFFRMNYSTLTCEVKNLSHSGMSLEIKDPSRLGEDFVVFSNIEGILKWRGQTKEITGKITRIDRSFGEIGVEFSRLWEIKEWEEFFSLELLISSIKEVPLEDFPFKLPNDLKKWWRGEGVFEALYWINEAKEELLQVLLWNDFVEFSSHRTLKTAKMSGKVSVEIGPGPLLDQATFLFDLHKDEQKVERIKKVLSRLALKDFPTFFL